MVYEISGEYFLLFKETSKFAKLPLLYCLVDPDSNKIRYIGKSLNGINRAREHVKPSSLKNDGTTPKANWIRGLLKNNKQPIIYILAYFPKRVDRTLINNTLYNSEQWYINKFKQLGHDLLNLTDGGPGAVNRQISEITREKMSKSAKARELPEALKLNNQIKYGPPVPKYMYYKKKIKKDPDNLYIKSLMKSVFGRNLTTNNEVVFSSVNDCEKYFKSIEETAKFNRTMLRRSIKHKVPYYGYIWSFK